MVDSEYSPDKYKTLKESIGTIIKNPFLITLKQKRFVKIHLKSCCF